MSNNTCKKEVEYENKTIMDMMAEINRLTQELADVKAENIMLRSDNEILHNKFCTEKDLKELEEMCKLEENRIDIDVEKDNYDNNLDTLITGEYANEYDEISLNIYK